MTQAHTLKTQIMLKEVGCTHTHINKRSMHAPRETKNSVIHKYTEVTHLTRQYITSVRAWFHACMQTHNRLHSWTNQQEKFEHSEIKTGVHTHKCSHQRDDAMCVSTGQRGNGAKMQAVTHRVQVGAEALGLTLTKSCINLGSEKKWTVNCGGCSHEKYLRA